MNNRKFVYAFMNPHNSISVVNYNADNNTLNTFLSLFDVWDMKGQFKLSNDNNHQEVWFEWHKSLWDALHTDPFSEAFRKMGVTLVFEYPYEI